MTGGPTRFQRYDVAILGAGHNGLVAAAYLARAGLSVMLLERLDRVGGAAVSTPLFAGWSTKLSPYASMVSLMPDRLMADLQLNLQLRSRPLASYTPVERGGRHVGLAVERPEGTGTRTSFRELTGSNREYDAWCSFHADVAALARTVEPTLLQPLPVERDVEARVDPATWRELVLSPLGETLERRFADDIVRGLVASAALVGTLAPLHDPSLAQNRSFLYQAMGRGTGEGRVPVGGMGAIAGALHAAATRAGAETLLGAAVSAIRPGEELSEVVFETATCTASVEARFVLANLAPWVLHALLGEPPDGAAQPEGAQLVVDLLVERLPRLRSGIDPRVAFAGTLHVGQGYRQLEQAHRDAGQGHLPNVIPAEVTCPTLTDGSVLGTARPGMHVLSYRGFLTRASAFLVDPERAKDEAVRRALLGLDEQLAEPIASVLARDAHGRPCLQARTPHEVEAELAMPGGHMFHGDLEWPWAGNRARLDTPDQIWGVATGFPRVFVCGAGARRGGGVSGIGGQNAAMAVLAAR